jgi:hypothetical protein
VQREGMSLSLLSIQMGSRRRSVGRPRLKLDIGPAVGQHSSRDLELGVGADPGGYR